MSRRRNLPWIYRWSRPIIGAIAICGAVLTAYLTYEKFTGGVVGCVADAAAGASGGCNNVLNSPYATVFGLPLSLFGCVSYTSMSVFALSPYAIAPQANKTLRNKLEEWTWLLLLAGGFAMTVFSGYLMTVLATELKTFCPYCVGSALFATSILTLTIIGRDWEDIGQVLFTGLAVGVVTLVAVLGIYSDVGSNEAVAGAPGEQVAIPLARTQPVPPKGWEINTTSGESELALAEYLSDIGAKKYGAFWCPHCYEQKQLFGEQAFEEVNYIECAQQGVDPQPQACQAAGVASFPTWEINGELYPGVKSLEELARISNYEGSTDFRYKLR